MRILLILAAALLLYFLAYHWFARQPKQQRIQTLLVLTGILLIGLVATGRANWIFALLGAALPFVRRVMMLLNYLPLVQRLYRQFGGSGKAGSSGQQSRVETRFLRLVLDHDSGEMSGTVLEGAFSGRALAELTLDQLLQLLTQCRQQDEESAQLLEAYLDRVHDSDWRQQAGGEDRERQSSGFSDAMGREEALQILGLEEGASRDEIKLAHRRLMQKLHPDRGGSTYLAWKINQAKTLLLDDD
jgi:hypothetical protein